jgi:hypothetical protein
VMLCLLGDMVSGDESRLKKAEVLWLGLRVSRYVRTRWTARC